MRRGVVIMVMAGTLGGPWTVAPVCAQPAPPGRPPVHQAAPAAVPARPAVVTGRPITRPAGAGNIPAADTGDGMPRGSASPWTTIGALAVIVGLLLIGGRLWKKHGPATAHGLPAAALELLGRRIIDRRQSIHLVRCGSRILVLGSSEAGLRTLAEITDPVEVDYLAGLCRQAEGDSSFAQSFTALFHKRNAAQFHEGHEPTPTHSAAASDDAASPPYAGSPWEQTHA